MISQETWDLFYWYAITPLADVAQWVSEDPQSRLAQLQNLPYEMEYEWDFGPMNNAMFAVLKNQRLIAYLQTGRKPQCKVRHLDFGVVICFDDYFEHWYRANFEGDIEPAPCPTQITPDCGQLARELHQKGGQQ